MSTPKNPHVAPEESDRTVDPEPADAEQTPPDGPVAPARSEPDDPRRRATVRERKAVR